MLHIFQKVAIYQRKKDQFWKLLEKALDNVTGVRYTPQRIERCRYELSKTSEQCKEKPARIREKAKAFKVVKTTALFWGRFFVPQAISEKRVLRNLLTTRKTVVQW